MEVGCGLLTREEAASRLGISPEDVRHLVEIGHLPRISTNGGHGYLLADVDALRGEGAPAL